MYRLMKPLKSKTLRLPKNFVYLQSNFIALVSVSKWLFEIVNTLMALKKRSDFINLFVFVFLAVLAEDAIKAALADYRLKQKDDKETSAEARN